MRTSTIWCVIPAAGVGQRFGGSVPKQYQSFAGQPLLRRTMERIAAHPWIAGLVVVLSEQDGWWDGAVVCEGKPVRTAIGGEQRCHSVLAGLDRLAGTVDAADWVLVHDAARPCLPLSDLTRLIEEGSAHPCGAILASAVRDTLKRGADRDIETTVPRERLYRALTPQLFRLGELRELLRRAIADPALLPRLTDEASAFELAGRSVGITEGSEQNLKVTLPADLAFAEVIWQQQELGTLA